MLRRLILAASALVLLLLVALGGFLYWLVSGDGVRQGLEQQASAWLGQPVSISSASAQVWPRPAIHLTGVRVGSPVRLTLGSVDVSTELRPLLSRRLEEAAVVVADSRIDLPLPFGLPRGGGSGSASSGIQLVSVRRIAFENVTLASRGHEVKVNAASSLVTSTLRLESFSAESGRTRLEGEGLIELNPRVDGQFRVRANRLDVDELMTLATAFSPASPGASDSPATLPVRIAARVSSEVATAGGVEVRQFATDLEAQGTAVSLSPLNFQLFGGRYQGSLVARFGSSLDVTLRSRVSDVDVAALAAFGGAPGTVTGKLTGAGTFSGRGADLSAVLAGARGSGSATIVNGSLKGLGLVRTVVLFFGRPAPDASASTDAFRTLDARFSVANQLLTADALSLHSDDADVVGGGTLSLTGKRLDGRLDLSLSEALSAQAGTDLYRYTREGNRIVLPATIGGTLESPRLSIDASAAIQRGLRNEVQRRLKGLLERFGAGQAQSAP